MIHRSSNYSRGEPVQLMIAEVCIYIICEDAVIDAEERYRNETSTASFSPLLNPRDIHFLRPQTDRKERR